MKKIYRYIALAAVTIGFAACTQEEDFAPQQSDIVQIASAHIATEVQTRVNTEGNGDAFENTDEILLVNNTRTDKNEGTYTYNNSTWSPTAGMVLWASGSNQFTAYYPASETFELPTDQSTLDGLKSADRMTATVTVNKGDAVSLSFSHVNAKVTITTSFASQYDASTTISDLKIGGISPYIVDNAYTAILEPTANGFTVTLTVNGTDELTATSPTALVAGNHYTFNLTVGKSVATLGTVSVKDWGGSTELTSGEAKELKATYTIENGTATITIPQFATAAMVQKSVTEAITAGATVLMIADEPTLAQQTAIATALTGNTGVALVMGGVTAPATAITELTDIDLAYKNGTGENGHVVTADGYIITSKSGLDAWQTVAATDGSTNLTLACDIEYNGSWQKIYSYKGTIDGNGYAIVGLKHTATDYSSFIQILDNGGVIKHLGMVGGSFSNSEAKNGNNSSAFAITNHGIIMGCYNTSSCTSAVGDFGAASGIAKNNMGGVIIACYNAGTISAGGDFGAGICYRNSGSGLVSSCYNTGTVSSKSTNGYVACAITADNDKGIMNDCYYTQPSLGYYGGSTGTATNITRFTGSDWTTPMNTMNAAIEAYNAGEANTVKCNYKYIINTDDATKAAQPLVIVEFLQRNNQS